MHGYSSIDRNVFTKKWVGTSTTPTIFLEEIEAEYDDNK